MNTLLTTMSEDMGIFSYQNESYSSFVYRVCYSALGQWCLKTSQNLHGDINGTSKHNQTSVVKDLILDYSEMFPEITEKFNSVNDANANFPVHIRRVYEETGYLLTDMNNKNRLANYGRGVAVGNEFLYFGEPVGQYTVNGLGVFQNTATFTNAIHDFLIRDTLTVENYFNGKYNILDFYEKDIDLSELEFFNPLAKTSPSQSWSRKLCSEYSIARKNELGPFYRVIKDSAEFIMFVDEIIDAQGDKFTDYEYRRLYFALKLYYNNPLIATIYKIDEEYSRLRILGYLPNREYYFLLLVSWPINSPFDKCNFLIKNAFVPEIQVMLNNIGITVHGGTTHAKH